jgi:hypothetical protein
MMSAKTASAYEVKMPMELYNDKEALIAVDGGWLGY